MNQKIGPYHIVDLPPARRDVPNLLDLFWWGHTIYGLMEVDVTVARRFIDEYEARTGEGLSFTGYLAFCLARTVDEDKSVQAYLKGRKQLVLFDDVDVLVMIERQMGGTRAPMGHVIRRANQKTYLEIHQEIRAVQARPAPPSKGLPPWIRFFQMLPGPLPQLFNALIRIARRRDPVGMWVAKGGTVSVTSIGMFGKGSAWGLTPAAHSLSLVVGSIATKPAVVGGRIEPREILCLTVAFDHDIVDGAPAARFGRRLAEVIESGYGLDETNAAMYHFTVNTENLIHEGV